MSHPSRREVLTGASALPLASQVAEPFWKITPELVARHDNAVDQYLKLQTVNPASPWHGGIPDAHRLHNPGSAAGAVHVYAVALLQPVSRHRGSTLLMERLRLALDFVRRKSSPEGNLSMLITNFNSPPDTAFAMYSLAGAASLARRYANRELEGMLEPVVKRAAEGVARGGVHTPNHRWVNCAALAQAQALYPYPLYMRRIDEWLAEGVDIDGDGQYSERSTTVYNGVVDRALTVAAIKLNRPELLGPVRRNLDSMLYLLHPDYEVVTEISRRQDQFERGGMQGYWLALRYLALKDGNGMVETLARRQAASLGELMEFPDLMEAGPEPAPVPQDYEKQFPVVGIARIRRGLTSATMVMGGSSRFFGVRRGQAIVNSVRFASAFFGKAQFVPERAAKRGGNYVFEQSLDAGYYQPFGDGRKQPVGVDEWYQIRNQRRRTEVCRLRQSATLTELRNGFTVRIEVSGTDDVPVAVEINLGGKGELQGGEELKDVKDGWLLLSGQAVWRVGGDAIRIGPGRADHTYTQVRGAESKLAGPSLYLTGYTPFDHTVRLEWGTGV